jgi:hypothetical protein
VGGQEAHVAFDRLGVDGRHRFFVACLSEEALAGVEPDGEDSTSRPGVTREEIAEGLRPLLALPVENVLSTHGGPIERATLERALS